MATIHDLVALGLIILLLVSQAAQVESKKSIQGDFIRRKWNPVEDEGQVHELLPKGDEQEPGWMMRTPTTDDANPPLPALPTKGSNPSVDIDSVNPEHLDVMAYTLARSQLEREWPFLDKKDLACSTADSSKVGFVHKYSDLHDRPPKWNQPYDESPLAYREDRIPIYDGCMVYVSVKHKFIYLRQPKSSSTSVMLGIAREFCQNHKLEKEKTNTIIQAACSAKELHNMSRKQIDREQWKNFFVFTVVRNPWRRMLSAYDMLNDNDLHRNVAGNKGQMGETCGLPFHDFSEDSAYMLDLCQSNIGCCAFWNQPGGGWRFMGNKHTGIHMSEQQHCVFQPDGTSMVDFIGTTETLEEDWVTIVSEIRRRTNTTVDVGDISALSRANPVDFYSHSADATSATTKNPEKKPKTCSGEETTKMLDETALHNIAWQYALDVKRFGYL